MPSYPCMKLSQNIIVGSLIVGVASVTALSMWAMDQVSAPEQEESVVSSTADIATIASSVRSGCETQECLEDAVLGLIEPYGPVEALGVLTTFLNAHVMYGRGDYHDFVHRIGRLTAKKEGLNPEGFFLCPVDFNYGCQHGFFEQALVEEPDPTKAAQMVCDETLMMDKPLKFFFYCYHGVGHGVMMAKAYDLPGSLAVCESFAGADERTGCYQGVFMENVVGHMKNPSTGGMFSDTNLLAPCDAVAPKYRWQCYINHGGYLAGKAGAGPGAVERATQPCLKADGDNIRVCLGSVGLTGTNPGWQPALAPAYDPEDFTGNAVDICTHFPKGYELDCIIAGVDNLAQFDRGDTTRMSAFCAAISDAGHREQCFLRVGRTVQNELPAGTPPSVICGKVPQEYRAFCIAGVPS